MKILSLLTLIFSTHLFAQVSLLQVDDFGTNPGNLKMYSYSPAKISKNKALVVLLHGCAQVASDFDNETGWTKIADAKGFHLLLPQQKELNNDWRCFNWFDKDDITRDQGEIASIIQMIDHMIKTKAINHKNIYIAGLSAGGAMTATLLATYPEYFKAGAVVAGIPVGCATTLVEAYPCMYGQQFPIPSPTDRGELVRAASGNYQGKWPKVMIVHGSLDEFVFYKNAFFHILQWSNVHRIDHKADQNIKIGSHVQSFYQNRKGENILSLLTIHNQKHGYPIDSKNGCGVAGKYLLDSGICVSDYIAKFFEL